MKEIDLTKGKVTSVILALAIPIMGSSLLQFAYNIIDMIWVGGLGSDAVASVGSVSFFTGLGYAINALVVVGTGIKVSHSIGEKNELNVKKYINAGIIINIIIALIFSFILILFGKELIDFLNLQNEKVEVDAYKYMAVNGPVIFLGFFNTLYTRVFNSFGNNKEAFIISTIGVVINIVLDPILIYIFKMGIIGAAIGTLISNIVMIILFHKKSNGTIKYDFKNKIEKNKIIEIIKLGFPMASQRILFTVINIFLAKIIAIFGSDAVAAQKIGVQIESVTFMVVGGLNGAVSTFVGQNYGGKNYKRVIEGYKSSIKIGVGYSLITALAFLIVPDFFVKIFLNDVDTIAIASAYLRIIALAQIFSAIEMVSNGFFTGIGKPKIPAFISVFFTALRLPMALLLINIIGINGVWLSIALSSFLKGITSYIAYKKSGLKNNYN